MNTVGTIIACPRGTLATSCKVNKTFPPSLTNIVEHAFNTKEKAIFSTSFDNICREELLTNVTYYLPRFEPLRSLGYSTTVRFETRVEVLPHSIPYLRRIFNEISPYRHLYWEFNTWTKLEIPADYFNVSLISFVLFFVKYNEGIFKSMPPYEDNWLEMYKRLIKYDKYDGKYIAFALYMLMNESNVAFLVTFDNSHGDTLSGIADSTLHKLSEGRFLRILEKFNKLVGLDESDYNGQVGYLLEVEKLLSYEQYRKYKMRRTAYD
jgi:hypothetical protein